MASRVPPRVTRSPYRWRKWPKMDQYDQNPSKFKNLVYFSQKIPIIDPVHSVIMYRHGFGEKMASRCIWGRARTSKRLKKGLKMTHLTLYQELMKNNEIFSSKP